MEKSFYIFSLIFVSLFIGCTKKETIKQEVTSNSVTVTDIQEEEPAPVEITHTDPKPVDVKFSPVRKSKTDNHEETTQLLTEQTYQGNGNNNLKITFYEFLPLKYETKKADYEYDITSAESFNTLYHSEDFMSKIENSTFSFHFSDDEEELFLYKDLSIYELFKTLKIIDFDLSGCKKTNEIKQYNFKHSCRKF